MECCVFSSLASISGRNVYFYQLRYDCPLLQNLTMPRYVVIICRKAFQIRFTSRACCSCVRLFHRQRKLIDTVLNKSVEDEYAWYEIWWFWGSFHKVTTPGPLISK